MGNDQIIRVQKYPETNQVPLLFPFAAEIFTAVKTISSKTIEIYMHVSMKNITNIRNPLDEIEC
jgi:hypothetical protein